MTQELQTPRFDMLPVPEVNLWPTGELLYEFSRFNIPANLSSYEDRLKSVLEGKMPWAATETPLLHRYDPRLIANRLSPLSPYTVMLFIEGELPVSHVSQSPLGLEIVRPEIAITPERLSAVAIPSSGLKAVYERLSYLVAQSPVSLYGIGSDGMLSQT